MAERWREPIPQTYYKPGDIVFSPGKSLVYEVRSYPFCRLYWGNGKPEPNTIESSWRPKDPDNPDAGWTKQGANYLSYRVRLLEGGSEFDWTDRTSSTRTRKTPPIEQHDNSDFAA